MPSNQTNKTSLMSDASITRTHELCFLALDHIDKGVVVMTHQGVIIHCNNALYSLLGKHQSSLNGTQIESYFVTSDDQEVNAELIRQKTEKEGSSPNNESKLILKTKNNPNPQSEFNLFSTKIRSATSSYGETLSFIYFEASESDTSLKDSFLTGELANYRKVMFDSAFDAIVVFNASGVMKDYNKAFSQIFELDDQKIQAGNLRQFVPSLMDSFDRGKRYYETLLQDEFKEFDGLTLNNKSVNLDVVVRELDNFDHPLFFASLRDNTARKSAESNLVLAVRFDSLTGLANRAYLREELQKRIKIGQRYQRKFGLLFVDLDRFKSINDTLGNQAGDQLLKEVARRIQDAVRDTDLVARLSGDEFCVILDDLAKPGSAKIVANKILTHLNKPFKLQGMELKVGVSIGISIYPQDGEDEDTLTKHADAAMHEAKSQGLSSFCFFNHAMNQHAVASIAVENELRRSIQQSHLIPYYQPQIDIQSGRIIGIESLIRWRHPNQGMVMPGTFIPIAEETGLIVDLGKISIVQGMKDSLFLKQKGIKSVKTSINLSPKQFRDENLVDTLGNAIYENGLDPKDVVLEITEGHLVKAGGDKNDKVLEKLKSLGVLIAIDDFGTGYSSFSYLKNLPIDIVKIDKSFVDGSESDSNARNLISGIIDIIHGLGMSVVAEGVENRSQAELLKKEGCEVVQGYYFGKPMPLNDLIEWYAKFNIKDDTHFR